MKNKSPEAFDIIEIIPSHYAPSHPIGNKYVAVGTYDGHDAQIINEKGEFDIVCGEDFKIIGNVKEQEKSFLKRAQHKEEDEDEEDITNGRVRTF